MTCPMGNTDLRPGVSSLLYHFLFTSSSSGLCWFPCSPSFYSFDGVLSLKSHPSQVLDSVSLNLISIYDTMRVLSTLKKKILILKPPERKHRSLAPHKLRSVPARTPAPRAAGFLRTSPVEVPQSQTFELKKKNK